MDNTQPCALMENTSRIVNCKSTSDIPGERYVGVKGGRDRITGLMQHMTLNIDPRLAPVHLNATMWTNHFLRKSDFFPSSHKPKDCCENYLERAF